MTSRSVDHKRMKYRPSYYFELDGFTSSSSGSNSTSKKSRVGSQVSLISAIKIIPIPPRGRQAFNSSVFAFMVVPIPLDDRMRRCVDCKLRQTDLG